ncbi:uncharacterized protein LTR77_008069 [Saxophila tyrrhenica]|uniref:Cerato-platanin n=1 Tax=Saxophila tyrrhenica TaxID=1690608 RepID=A0AAV9P4J7_9PEZI|nr:hypothetical protein LTR77_008069 [Saxophila tyrrhenica]
MVQTPKTPTYHTYFVWTSRRVEVSVRVEIVSKMKTSTIFAAATAITTATSLTIPVKRGTGVSITPHDRYSSSIGVLGCKLDVNRVAYWPGTPSCDGMCIRVNANGRSVNLLQIDSSGGAYDISYDAWNYLMTGQSALQNPVQGGGLAATYEKVEMSQCADIMKAGDGKLGFTAANSMNYITSCRADSWVGQNHVLYNIADTQCTLGIDEVCTLNMAVSNQPSCPHQLGVQPPLTSDPVYDIIYGSGKKELAQ